MTGMEVFLYNREFAESQVKNRMRTITFDKVYPAECMRYLEAMMYERLLEVNQTKTVRNLPAGLIGEETMHSNQTYPVATLEVKNRQVNNKEKKKKVWTKLANGLYAWRMKRVPKSHRVGNHSSNSAE